MTTTRSSRSTTAKKISLRVCRLNLRKKMYFFRKPLATPKQKIDATHRHCYHENAGWSSLVARWAHNPKVGGSNPPPATKFLIWFQWVEPISSTDSATLNPDSQPIFQKLFT